MDKFRHFCDNPKCPNYDLPMNDEKHYHPDIDKKGVGGICGVLQTYPITITREDVIKVPVWFVFHKNLTTKLSRTIHLCDICQGALKTLKEFEENVKNI